MICRPCGTCVARTARRGCAPIKIEGGGTCPDLPLCDGAGEGNRTLMTSLEGWRSAIELRPRARQGSLDGHRVGIEQRTGCGTLAPNRKGSIQTMPRRMVAAADPGSAGR
jgi:hypothetical protein